MKTTGEGAKTSVFKIPLIGANIHCDNHPTGRITKLLEDVAYVTAVTFSRRSVGFISVDRIQYEKPLEHLQLLEIAGEIVSDKNLLLSVKVNVHTEHLYSHVRQQVGSANFTFIKLEEDLEQAVAQAPTQVNLSEFVGGEVELRQKLNSRLFPKTVSRATLYKYLSTLQIRKVLYTEYDFSLVINYVMNLKTIRKNYLK